MITRLFSEENIYALGWTVLHSLWQAFLVALLMGVILLFLQKRSAPVRYWLANGALLLVFLISLLTFFFLKQQTVAGEGGDLILLLEAPSAVTEMEPAGFQSWWDRFLAYFELHLPMVVTCWLVGLGFFLLRMLGGLAYLERLRQSGRSAAADWQGRFDQIRRRLAVTRPVRLLESALVKTPMAIGVLKPVILMPVGVINGLSPAEVEAILAHELAHIRRSDYLFNIFQSILEVLYYFNPSVWWISANIRMERENCCDDLAVAFCGNSLIYAKALVKVEEMSRRAPAFAMAFSTGKNQMLNRVKRILNQSENRSDIMEKLTATFLLLLAIALFSISANQPLDDRQKNLEVYPLADIEQTAWRAADDASVAGRLVESMVREPLGKLAALPKRALESLLLRDTLPMGRTSLNFTRENGQKLEAKIKDGAITYLKIDGREIPASEYSQYESLLEEVLKNELPSPPPVPPAPGAAPAPPVPPVPSAVPAPPAPSAVPAPPAPPAPRHFYRSGRKVTTGKDKEGNTVITIESGTGEPMELIFDDSEKAVFLDGKLLAEGETVVLEERNAALNEAVLERDARAALREQELRLHRVEAGERRAAAEVERRIRDQERELRENRAKLEREEREMRHKLEIERQMQERLADHIEHLPVRGHGDGQLQKRLEEELLADKLITSPDGYSLELSNESLKINGQQQSDALHRKYLEIYREAAGGALTGKSKLEINKSK
jgi:beta-lactamase regulating signal transducer with metallopeptidase domain